MRRTDLYFSLAVIILFLPFILSDTLHTWYQETRYGYEFH